MNNVYEIPERMKPSTALIFIAILVLAIVLVPNLASAKRGPPPRVDPVDYEGVRYKAWVDDHRHCIQALDINTGKVLWNVTVYRTFIKPLLEEDVQWVFIKQIFIDRGALIVVAEDGRGYSVNLQNHDVKKLKHVPKKPQNGNTNVSVLSRANQTRLIRRCTVWFVWKRIE